MTPEIFWENKEVLLRADRTELSDVVKRLIGRQGIRPPIDWNVPPTPIERVGGRLLICSTSNVPCDFPIHVPGVEGRVSYVVVSEHGVPLPVDRKDILALELPSGKKGQIHFLQHVLPEAIPFIKKSLADDANLCVCCENGRDVSVGIAVVALQLFFMDDGMYTRDGGSTGLYLFPPYYIPIF